MKLPFAPHAPLRMNPGNSFAWRGFFGLWCNLAWGQDYLVRLDVVNFGCVSFPGVLCRKISDGLGGIISGRLPIYACCLAVRHLQYSVFGVFRWP